MHLRATDFIGMKVIVEIDRPLGSRHPTHGFLYPVNYGFVPGTLEPDGEALDAYVLGLFEPVKEYEGLCIAVIHRLNDDEDKLILIPAGRAFTDEQIREWTDFQERFFRSEIIRTGTGLRTDENTDPAG
ncbi:MAG: inorganic pyrophosphatase [Chloroflexi bacterium RBG_13_60_9]|nr:MAG: inorganic pyrophosphatase [Chloroflexi bacterium RBG_13_60_9]